MKERLEQLEVLLEGDYAEFKCEVLIWIPSLESEELADLIVHRKQFRKVVDEIEKILRMDFSF